MSVEQNKELTRRFVQEVLNTNDFSRADQYLAPDFIEHSAPPGAPPTLEGVKSAFAKLFATFPDFRYVIEDTIAEGDKVVLRMTAHGTMQGPWLGLPATDKPVAWAEIHIARVQNGKIVEHWDEQDRLGRMQQMGATLQTGQ